MREIGCRCFVLIQNRHNPKIYDRSIECILVGYDIKSKSYRCYHRGTRQIYSSYHVRFIESHEEPSTTTATPPTPTQSPLTHISKEATASPINFDNEDEELLPRNLRDPLPNLNPEPEAAAPLPTPDSEMDNAPDPANPRRSTRVASAVPADQRISRMDKVRQEVAKSRLRKEEEKVERQRKRLEDIRQKELRNDPGMVDQEARENLCQPGDTRVVDDPVEAVAQVFKHLSLDDKDVQSTDRIDRILSAISDTSNIDPQNFASGSEPKDWTDSQKRPPAEAAEWGAAFKDECESLKEMGVYVLVPR